MNQEVYVLSLFRVVGNVSESMGVRGVFTDKRGANAWVSKELGIDKDRRWLVKRDDTRWYWVHQRSPNHSYRYEITKCQVDEPAMLSLAGRLANRANP